MSSNIVSQAGDELILEVKINLSESMLEAKKKNAVACNEIGLLGTGATLAGFDTDGSAIHKQSNYLLGR
jgi:hypothetical protein